MSTHARTTSPPRMTPPPFSQPASMTEATERLMGAYRPMYDAYAEASRTPMAGMPEWPAFGAKVDVREAGKQLGRAYVEAVDTYLSLARRMLDQ